MVLALLVVKNLFHRQMPMAQCNLKSLAEFRGVSIAKSKILFDSDPNHILPNTLYVIYGLESSGTTFLTRVIARAAGMPDLLDNDTIESNDKKIHIQHLSLPLGTAPFKNASRYHQQFESLDVIKVFYPTKCHVEPNRRGPPDWKVTPEECQPLLGKHVLAAPSRYFVNITTHVEWYRNHGVVVKPIVVVRDPSFHFEGILRTHCENVTAAMEQYETGKAIIVQSLATIDPLVVSYETLMTLKGGYLHNHVYRQLGLSSNFTPPFKNGNLKYAPNSNVTSLLLQE